MTPTQFPAVPDVLVIDTCVLISNVLRRLLLRLAGQGCFRPAWSPVIGDEWCRNAGRLWGVDDEMMRTQWQALQQDFPQADQGDVSPFKEGLKRSDRKDWHVIAAARAAKVRWPQASVAVLTRNLRDFNRTELRQWEIGLHDPDQLLVRMRPGREALMDHFLAMISADYAAAGREPEPLQAVLKKERLFRLNRLIAVAAENAQEHEQV